MKYKTIIQICFCLLLTSLILLASNSAPVSTTGAPGEMTCAKSDCHSDKALNSGVGLLTLSFENNVTEYIPGKTYKVKINIHESNIIRFGFQVLALNDNNKNVGVIKISEPERTQILSGFDALSDSQYLTYKYKGTDAVSNSNGEWTFEWTAPSIDEGPVTFYLAGITANNDGTDQGDNCYTKSFKINPSTLGVENNSLNNDFNIKINNNNNQIYLNYILNINSDIKIDLYNINGIKINEWNYINEIAGNHNKYLLLNSNLNNGTYILNIYSNYKNQSQKFNINN